MLKELEKNNTKLAKKYIKTKYINFFNDQYVVFAVIFSKYNIAVFAMLYCKYNIANTMLIVL